MSRLGRRDNPLCSGELDRGFKGRDLFDCHGLNMPGVMQATDTWCHTVITQTTCVDAGRDKVVTERVHFDNGSHLGRVAVVEGVYAFGQAGCRSRLNS